jgi:hypothetical protein
VLVPTTGKSRAWQSILDTIALAAEKLMATEAVAASAYPVKQNNPLTAGVNGLHLVERRRVELPTSALRINPTRSKFLTSSRY